MDSIHSNSDLSLRSNKSAWFNLKYLLLFLNMILVYVNSGLFFYLFTKDFRKVQHFNLKDYPNLRYVTQMSSERIQGSMEAVEKATNLEKTKVLEFANNLDEETYLKSKPEAISHKYPALDEVVSMFGQQESPFDNVNFGDLTKNKQPEKQLKRFGLLDVIRFRKDDSNDDVGGQAAKQNNNQANDQLNKSNDHDKKNKTLIKKTNHNDVDNLNKQLSLIYLLLALNNFLNFICLTKEKSQNFLLILTLPSIFTILPLIITKFNCEINLWLFMVYIFIAILTWIHVKRLKRSTSEQLSQHITNQLYHNQHFVSLESNNPTSTQQFLINQSDHESCKSGSQSGKDKANLISLDKKMSATDQQLNGTPAIKRIMNLRTNYLTKQMTPPPSYEDLL